MRKLVFAGVTVAALGVVQPAMSADLPAEPYKASPLIVPLYDWTGFYVGLNGGYSWGNSSNTDTLTGYLSEAGAAHMNGGVFGGQLGYNWQVNRSFVFGVEADAQLTWQKGTDSPPGVSTTNCISTFIAACTVAMGVDEKLRWFGTARGRFGFLPTDRVMLYVTGGVAFGEVEWDATASNMAASPYQSLAVLLGEPITTFSNGTVTSTRVGYTVGGGSEWELSGGWTGKLEYLYVDLGTIANTFTGGGVVPTFVISSHVHDNIVRIGLNYRFGGPVVASY